MPEKSTVSAKQVFFDHASAGASAAPELTRAWEQRKPVSVAQAAACLGDGDIFSAKVVAGSLAVRSGGNVAPGPARLPDPALKIALNAADYNAIVEWQRGVAAADFIWQRDTDVLGGLGFLSAVSLAATVGLGVGAAPAFWGGMVPTGMLCMATGYAACDAVNRAKDIASTRCGLVTRDLYEASPRGARDVFDALQQRGNIAGLPRTTTYFRLQSLAGAQEIVDANVDPTHREAVMDHLRVVMAEGKRVEFLRKADYLQSQAAQLQASRGGLQRQPAAQHRGYQVLADEDTGAPAGFHEALSFLLEGAAGERSNAEACGNLLPFRDRIPAEDAAFEARATLTATQAAHRATLQGAGKPDDFIERSLRSHPQIQALELELTRLEQQAPAPPAQRMRRG